MTPILFFPMKAVNKIFEDLEELCVKEKISEAPVKIGRLMCYCGADSIAVTRFLADMISLALTEKAEREHPSPELPKDYTPIERAIHEMLIENTGVHILDSGGAYGRHWERNREIEDFRKTPEVYVTVWEDGDMVIYINIFHFLTRTLDIDKTSIKLNRSLERFANREENKRLSWLDIMEEFAVRLEECGWEAYGPWNSYNWENYLSQVIQGITLYSPKEEPYVILQIHNGCDVRGGYTKPRIFKIADEVAFFGCQDGIIAHCKCTSLSLGLDNWDIPEYWKVVPKHKNAESWEYKLKCSECRRDVQYKLPEFDL